MGRDAMEWCEIFFDPSAVELRVPERLASEIHERLMDAGLPVEAALFADGSLDPFRRRFYLSPLAASLARDLVRAHGGRSCERPNASPLVLMNGDQRAKEVLFGVA